MTPNGQELLADDFPLWHGTRAGCQKGVHADDLADLSEAQTRAQARDAVGMEEPQASEAGRNERSSASSQRADGGRSLKDR
jgi:hypothetical protein